MKKLCLYFIVFFFISCGFAQAQVPTGPIDMVNQSNGREFSLYVPITYNPNKTYPLYVCLHNQGEAANIIRYIFDMAAEKADFIVLCPDENGHWDGVALSEGYQWTLSTYNIDQENIIFGGMGVGANVMVNLSIQNIDLVKGQIYLSPNIAEKSLDSISDASNERIARIHGSNDENNTVFDEFLNEYESLGAETLTITKDGFGSLADQPMHWHYRNVLFTNEFLEMYYFVTGFEAPDPNAPHLNKPAKNQMNLYPEGVAYWNTVDLASSYTIEIASDSDFNNIIVSEDLSRNYYYFSLEHNTEYYWRVSANIDDEKAWSKGRSFTTSDEKGIIYYSYFLMQTPFYFDWRLFGAYIPDSYDESKETELFIGLQGLGQPLDNYLSVFQDFAEDKDFILLCPDAGGTRHDDEFEGREINIINEALRIANNRFNIDDSNIYLTGYSYGGRESLYYILSNTDKFNGALCFAPAIQGMEDVNNNFDVPWEAPYKFENAENIKMAFIYGSNDQGFFDEIEAMSDKLIDHNANLVKYVLQGADHGSFFLHQDYDQALLDAYDHLHSSSSVDILSENKIKLYPIPAENQLNLEIENINSAIINYSIYDMNGNLMLYQHNILPLTSLNEQIELNDFPSGDYIVKLKIGDKITSRKFTVVK